MSGLAPNRGISFTLAVIEVNMMQTTIGRNATPASTGEKPRFCCR